MPLIVARDIMLRTGVKEGSGELVRLAAGETFEVLELGVDCAWGVAPAHRLVGYVPSDALVSADDRS